MARLFLTSRWPAALFFGLSLLSLAGCAEVGMVEDASTAVQAMDAYKRAKSQGSVEGWDSFLYYYPSGLYASKARKERDRLAQIRQREEDSRRRAQEERDRVAREQAEARAKAAREKEVAELTKGRIAWSAGRALSSSELPIAETHSGWDNLAAVVASQAKDDVHAAVGDQPSPPPTITQDRYESRAEFDARVAEARQAYEDAIASYNQRVQNYSAPVYRHAEIIKNALPKVFGAPGVVQTNYDPDAAIFSAKVTCNSPYAGDFKQNFILTDTVPNRKAASFDNSLQSATPRVVFQLDGTKLTIASVEFDIDGKTYTGLPAKMEAGEQKLAAVDLSSMNKSLAVVTTENIAVSYSGDNPQLAAKLAELTRLRKANTEKTQLQALEAQIAELKKGGVTAFQSDVDKPAFAQRPERAQDFAVVVGIESYQNDLPKADFAERDAATVKKYLLALGVPEQNIKLLTGAQATQSKLKSVLENYLPMNVTEDSRVYFYYSGHGAPDPEKGTAYLVPWEADPADIQTMGFPVSQLYGDLKKLKAKEVLVAMDACFSGGGGRSVLAKGARPLVHVVNSQALLGNNTTLLAAAKGNQITGTLDDQGHGLFTYYFLKGLNENAAGALGTDYLCHYLTPKVESGAARSTREQTPVCAGPDINFW